MFCNIVFVPAVSKVDQACVYTYTFPFRLFPHAGHHSACSSVPLLYISHLFYTNYGGCKGLDRTEQLTNKNTYCLQCRGVSPNLPVSSAPPFPSCCPWVCSLCLCLYLGFANMIIYTIVAQLVNNPPAMRETWVRSLLWEDPLEKGKATHSTWRIPWTIESRGRRVGHD